MKKEGFSHIVKYFCNAASKEEQLALTEWLKDGTNRKAFKEISRVNYLIDYLMYDFDTKTEKEKVLKKIQEQEKLHQRQKRLQLLKYAALIVCVFGVGYYLFTTTASKINPVPTTVVVKEGIKPGVDKAVLTLEDGSQVVLEKGREANVKGLSKNGDKLVYKKEYSKNVAAVKYNYLAIPRGGQYYIQLSDETKVWLNADSKLKYPVSFVKGQPRQVELLYGEAYFEVSKSTAHGGSPFLVKTAEQTVEVLGTQFNVKAYADEDKVYTTLVEGKVAIDNGAQKKMLNPAQQAIIGPATAEITVKNVKIFDEVAWKEGYFSFRSKSMEDIMKTLSRWYDMEYVFKNPDKKAKAFTGVLDRGNEIDHILNYIKKTNEINFEIYDKIVIIE